MKNRFLPRSITAAVLAAILFASLTITMPSPVFAVSDNEPFNWYAKRNKEHTLPALEPQMSFITEYNAVYGDTKAAECGDKVIYLTFDAGYENGNVERIINTLNKHKAPGAFFVLENFVSRNPALIKNMIENGHLICNHTKTHPDMTKMSDKAKFEAQLSGLDEALMKCAGITTAKFYRPPEGRFSRQNLKYATELGYKTVFWSFAYADWDNNRQPSADDAIEKILDNVHPGEIMLLHPTSKTNADILDRVLTTLENEGYRFASLNELP